MYCECGCGQLAPLAAQTNRKLGYVKGEPVRFVRGHCARRPEHRAKSAALARELGRSQTGEKNHLWKGDEAHYTSIHHWMSLHHPKTGVCAQCGAEGKTEWSNRDHEYRRVREDWDELCIRCHREKDGWSEKMLATRKLRHGY